MHISWSMASQWLLVLPGDLAGRLAVVPMSQEAKGLDAGPRLAEKLVGCGDNRSAAIVSRIAAEEKAHVAVGELQLVHACSSCQLLSHLRSLADLHVKIFESQLALIVQAVSGHCLHCAFSLRCISMVLHAQLDICTLCLPSISSCLLYLVSCCQVYCTAACVGVSWFRKLSAALGEDPGAAYQRCITSLGQQEGLRPPYNHASRQEVGLQQHW